MWSGHLDVGASRRQGLWLDVATHGVTSGRGTTAACRRHSQGGGSHRRPRMESPPSTAGQEEQELRERAFFSWAEFSRFFDAWCQQRLALFFVKSSMHLARCRWASAPPLYTLIDVLKYSYVRLVCKDVRAPSRPTVGPPRPGCPAFIIVKLSPLRDRLVVTECQLTHSHPACPLEFAYYFRPGHLLANACLPVRTTNKISKQFVAPADVRRLLSYCKGRDHGVLDALHVLEGLFRTDPEAKVGCRERRPGAGESHARASRGTHSPGAPVGPFHPSLRARVLGWVLSAGALTEVLGASALPGPAAPGHAWLIEPLQCGRTASKSNAPCSPGSRSTRRMRGKRRSSARVRDVRKNTVSTTAWSSTNTSFTCGRGGEAGKEPPLATLKHDTSLPEGLLVACSPFGRRKPHNVKDVGRNWAPRRDMWVRFRAFEAARDLDACALVRGHRRRLLRRLSPSRSVAQCLRDLVAMQWADAAGEAAPEGPDGGGPWPEGEPGRGAHGEKERMKGLESEDWAGTPKEGSIWRGAQLEKEWARGLEARDPGGAPLDSDLGRGLQIEDGRGSQLENEHCGGPEIRDWRGAPLEGEKDWGPEGCIWRGAWLEDHEPRAWEGCTWRMAQLEDGSIRVLETTERRGAPFDPERTRSLEGSTCREAQALEERAHGLKTRDWKGPPLEAEPGRGLEGRTWRGRHSEKPRELVPENGDPRGPQWGDERQRGPEIGEEREVRLGIKRRRDLEDVVLVQLGDTRVTGLENGEAARSVGPKGRGEQGTAYGGAGGRGLGLGNGVLWGTAAGTLCEGDPEWAGTRGVSLATGEGPQEGGQEEGPREPKRPCCPPAEEEADWEPLAKFRAACGPELAELVAEELAFARQHGTRGFHWTGAGFALKDGTSDFFLDRALTRCSCSIHAARRLPCRHLFAARLLTGAALFHMDLLRDCWRRAPEP
ncbi:uncharacterized protein ZSWIM9 [Suricata suricatta]|uniref:uncharacterized protein ZSWIM9 n=1 Tax=Suricata suricatta TaxID=37032 RepID=UPI001155F5D6|nr:uncharacterized protein ZSWIM9 [Suricata suricatta]